MSKNECLGVQIPTRMLKLPRDHRGFPYPWNLTGGKDGKQIFTANDQQKHIVAITFELCPLCGEPQEAVRWFVGGPSVFLPNRAYLDLPGHQDCIEFALRVCPYLATPNYMGVLNKPDAIAHISKRMPEPEPGYILRVVDPSSAVPDRPDIFVSPASKGWHIHPGPSGMLCVTPTRPLVGIQFWRHGQRLTYDEATPIVRRAINLPEWTVSLL